MQTPSVFMDHLTVQDHTEYGGLAVFPLTLVSHDFEAKAPFEVIGNGPHDEQINLMETGVMNHVRVVNRGTLPVLVPDGSILMGGAANRMMMASAVIRKNEIVNLPVVSVEAKRWDCKTFPSGKTQITAADLTFPNSAFAPASLRRVRLEESISAMKKKGVSRVDQDIIWRYIKELFKRSSVKTKSFDACELYNHWAYLLEEYSARFKPADLQVGCIVFPDRKTWYLDIFYNTDVFSKLFPNLLKSYAMEAIMTRIRSAGEHEQQWVPELTDAQNVFAKIKFIKFHTLKATGRKGEEIAFFASKKACGTALTDGPNLMHMAVCSRAIPAFQFPGPDTRTARALKTK